MRHVESPELFGVGVGTGTSGDIKCGICGSAYNQGADEAEDYLDRESVTHTTFAGLVVCECCFEKVENEIERRMPDILQWFRIILDRRRASLELNENALGNMAIKVIEASLDKRAVKRTPCMNCGVTLEFTRSDTTERMVRDYTGDGELCRFIKCPKCSHEIQVRL